MKSELRTITSERDGLLQRVNNIKEKTKQALESNARQLVNFNFAHICTSLNEKNDRLSEIKSITDSLKARSKDCFDFVDQMRSSATEL